MEVRKRWLSPAHSSRLKVFGVFFLNATLNTSKQKFSLASSMRSFPFFSTLCYEDHELLTGLSTSLVRMKFGNRRQMFVFVNWRSWVKTNLAIISRHVLADQGNFFFLKVKRTWKVIVFLNIIIVSCRPSPRIAKVSNQASLVTTAQIFCADLSSLVKLEVKED